MACARSPCPSWRSLLVASACSSDDDGRRRAERPTDGASECTRRSASGSRSTSVAWVTSRSTTLPRPDSTRRSPTGTCARRTREFVEANATGSNRDENIEVARRRGLRSGDRRRVRLLAGVNAIAADYPDIELRHHRRVRDLRTRADSTTTRPAERRRPHVQGAGGLLPGRRGRGDEGAGAATRSGSSAGRPARLIEKFEAGYTAGVRRPSTRTSRSWSSTSATTRPRSTTPSRARRCRPRCTTTARDHLPRRRRIGRGPVQGGRQGRQAGDRRRLRPVPDWSRAEQQPLDPDLDAEAGGHRRLRRDRAGATARSGRRGQVFGMADEGVDLLDVATRS